MPNPASSAARNPATHDTPNHATPDTTTSTTVTTTTRPGTKDQVETPTTGTPNPTGDRTNQVQNQEQFTNRAGISMVQAAAGSPVREANPDLGSVVQAVAGGGHAA
ncbi:MAG: hypothetical protein IPO93_16105 [Actinobacteria bacterium]|nr:hypothetical protein [Actinomycetota bacterium]